MKSTQSNKKKVKRFDPKYIGIPNICFSLTSKEDDREPEMRKQRLARGFDDSETWCVRLTMAQFIVPRLKRYREIIDGFLVDTDNLYADVDSAIRAFELVIKDDKEAWLTDDEWKEYERGMDAFGRVYMRLWW